jgi:hypothetical protein
MSILVIQIYFIKKDAIISTEMTNLSPFIDITLPLVVQPGFVLLCVYLKYVFTLINMNCCLIFPLCRMQQLEDIPIQYIEIIKIKY